MCVQSGLIVALVPSHTDWTSYICSTRRPDSALTCSSDVFFGRVRQGLTAGTAQSDESAAGITAKPALMTMIDGSSSSSSAATRRVLNTCKVAKGSLAPPLFAAPRRAVHSARENHTERSGSRVVSNAETC